MNALAVSSGGLFAISTRCGGGYADHPYRVYFNFVGRILQCVDSRQIHVMQHAFSNKRGGCNKVMLASDSGLARYAMVKHAEQGPRDDVVKKLQDVLNTLKTNGKLTEILARYR